MFISYCIIFYHIYQTIQKYLEYSKKHPKKITELEDFSENSLKLLIGKNINEDEIFIKENGLYQNMLVTGTIGTR